MCICNAYINETNINLINVILAQKLQLNKIIKYAYNAVKILAEFRADSYIINIMMKEARLNSDVSDENYPGRFKFRRNLNSLIYIVKMTRNVDKQKILE
jgi:hypothetical protein